MPVVWSTHDGGTAWRQQPLTGFEHYDPIFDLEASRGTVYLMGIGKGLGVTVESSPVGEDSWRVDRTPALLLPAGGAKRGAVSSSRAGRAGWSKATTAGSRAAPS